MKQLVLFLLVLFFNVSALAVTPAQMIQQAEGISQTSPKPPTVASKFRSPRATVKLFIDSMSAVTQGDDSAMKTVVATIDLTNVPKLIRYQIGQETAKKLYTIMQVKRINTYKHVPTKWDRLDYVLLKTRTGDVSLHKTANNKWLFSSNTVQVVPKIYDALNASTEVKVDKKDNMFIDINSTQLREMMPSFLKSGFLLEYWQWIGLFILVFLGSVADRSLMWILKIYIQRCKKNYRSIKDIEDDTLRPLGLMATAIMWALGLEILGLPDLAYAILSVALKLLVSLSGTWSAFRVVDIIRVVWLHKAAKTINRFDDLLAPLFTRSLKVFVVILGVVFVADNLNIDVSSLLTGLGIGGLAFALAAKDMLGNMFGSLTILMDRPFNIGDWVIIGDVEGTVEDVGFRSTRVRTFGNSLITMPNSLITTTKVDNMGARRYRRMKTVLALTYDTPADKIDAFCEGVRRIIQLHPYMRKDNYQVYFNAYGAASLDVLVYVFWAAPDWNIELRERHRFLLDILRLAKQLNVEFAYPTQTLYLKKSNEATDVVESELSAELTENDAKQLGRKYAESIVEKTLGSEVPGSVEFPR